MSALKQKIVLVIEYDGSRYHGFQLQAHEPTIQAELEAALYKLIGEKVRIIAASRTDTGVHAREQVISFRTNSGISIDSYVGGMNFYLPQDIAVKAAYRVNDSFNVRKDAAKREYKYYILESDTRSPLKDFFCCRVEGHLNTDLMNEACRLLIGKHDLASFTSNLNEDLKTTVRNVYQADVIREGEYIVFHMVANAFLPHQIRNTIGALLRVGQGKMTIDEFQCIMESKKIGLAGPAAPARGLFLTKINYPEPFEEKT